MEVRTTTSRTSQQIVYPGSRIREHTSVLLLLTEETVDLLTDFTLGKLDVVLGGTGVVHEGQEVIVSDIDLS